MVTLAEIKRFIEDKTSITVPMLQLQFNLSYGEAKSFMDKLVACKRVKFSEGLDYKVNAPSGKAPAKAVPSAGPAKGGFEVSHDDMRKKLVEDVKRIQKLVDAKDNDGEEIIAVGNIITADSKEKYSISDKLCREALGYCIEQKAASAAMLQKQFPIGYLRATKIIDWMESMKYISPSCGIRPREVYLKEEEYYDLCAEAVSRAKSAECEEVAEEGEKKEESKEQGEACPDTCPIHFGEDVRRNAHRRRIEYMWVDNCLSMQDTGLKFCNLAKPEFRVISRGGKYYISDCGIAAKSLIIKTGGDLQKVKEILSEGLEDSIVMLSDDYFLLAEIKNASAAVEAYYLMYWVIECALREN